MLLDKNSGIRQQDSNHVFKNIVYSSIGYFVAKEFFYNNIEEIISMKTKKGWVWNKFMDTQQIPVHILNFIVFDLDCVCGKLRHNISFCLWARKDNLKKFKTAKELSPEISGYVEDYFGVNYPLTKYDMIALPKLDFDCVEGLGISIFSST
ncbi:aminopeptidase Q-like [Lycorma delicatula]|uniref:aminopeptidase Q-like n=1 Tax=Lycorma delicatula TaxID=130591 RepID=UPI003F51AC53